MKRIRTIIALVLTGYLALYAVARSARVLVMYDGYRGAQGVDVADVGPAPEETVILCAVAGAIFRPLMQVETFARNGCATGANRKTI